MKERIKATKARQKESKARVLQSLGKIDSSLTLYVVKSTPWHKENNNVLCVAAMRLIQVCSTTIDYLVFFSQNFFLPLSLGFF